jgi:hypothetical protein
MIAEHDIQALNAGLAKAGLRGEPEESKITRSPRLRWRVGFPARINLNRQLFFATMGQPPSASGRKA